MSTQIKKNKFWIAKATDKSITAEYKEQSKWYGWYIVIISAVIGIALTAGFPQFTMVVGDLAIQMNTSENFLLFTDTIKAFAIMAGMLISGIVYNKLGLRGTFIISVIFMLVPQLIIPHLTSVTFLLPLKIVQGLCAMIFPIFLIIIMDWIKDSQRGLATAIFNGIFYGGSGVGAAVCGFTIAQIGWQASFYAVAIICVVPSIIWVFTVHENQQTDQKMSSSGRRKNEENKSSEKKVFGKTIRMPQIWFLIVCLLSTIWMVQVLSVDLPLWGEYLGYNSSSIGIGMIAYTIGIFAACLISGRCSDYYAGLHKNKAKARLVIMVIGPTLTIISIILLLVLDLTSLKLFFTVILICSFGGAWGLGAFYCILPELLDKQTLTFSTGFIGGIADIGMPISPLVVGVVFGTKGFWTMGWLSCISIAAISLLACLWMIHKEE